jgi:hypothetical protein
MLFPAGEIHRFILFAQYVPPKAGAGGLAQAEYARNSRLLKPYPHIKNKGIMNTYAK